MWQCMLSICYNTETGILLTDRMLLCLSLLIESFNDVFTNVQVVTLTKPLYN